MIALKLLNRHWIKIHITAFELFKSGGIRWKILSSWRRGRERGDVFSVGMTTIFWPNYQNGIKTLLRATFSAILNPGCLRSTTFPLLNQTPLTGFTTIMMIWWWWWSYCDGNQHPHVHIWESATFFSKISHILLPYITNTFLVTLTPAKVMADVSYRV